MLNKSMDLEKLAVIENQDCLDEASYDDDPLKWLLAMEKAAQMFEMCSQESASET